MYRNFVEIPNPHLLYISMQTYHCSYGIPSPQLIVASSILLRLFPITYKAKANFQYLTL